MAYWLYKLCWIFLNISIPLFLPPDVAWLWEPWCLDNFRCHPRPRSSSWHPDVVDGLLGLTGQPEVSDLQGLVTQRVTLVNLFQYQHWNKQRKTNELCTALQVVIAMRCVPAPYSERNGRITMVFGMRWTTSGLKITCNHWLFTT